MAMLKRSNDLAADQPSSLRSKASGEVDAFLSDIHAVEVIAPQIQPAKLIFALDATMSRAPTWALARKLQSEMFLAADESGKLEVQVVFFRGQFELRKSAWTTSPAALGDKMAGVQCQAGATQIGRVLRHISTTAAQQDIKAAVYIGDAVEENPGTLSDLAAQLGLVGVRLFMFQEGQDRRVERAMRDMARLSGGAYAQFNHKSAEHLKTLLRAVGAYAAGGHAALKALAGSNAQAAALLSQLPRDAD